VKKLLALSLLFGSALIVFYFAPTPPSRGQNEARRQTADVAHPFRTVAKTTREKGKVDEEAVAKFGEEIWIPASAG